MHPTTGAEKIYSSLFSCFLTTSFLSFRPFLMTLNRDMSVVIIFLFAEAGIGQTRFFSPSQVSTGCRILFIHLGPFIGLTHLFLHYFQNEGGTAQLWTFLIQGTCFIFCTSCFRHLIFSPWGPSRTLNSCIFWRTCLRGKRQRRFAYRCDWITLFIIIVQCHLCCWFRRMQSWQRSSA